MTPRNHPVVAAIRRALDQSLSHRASPLATPALLGLCMLGHATSAVAQHAPEEEIPTVIVSALALHEDALNVASSFSILEGEQLFQHTQATLGDTLSSQPGVHADTFGGGSARPVIRGQSGPRVKVLADGGSLLDASDISPDHAATVEPALVRRIEVLRGPATLLYGSGAVGGVVNVLDKRIPTQLPQNGYEGTLSVRGGTVANEKAAAAEVSMQASDNLVLHLEGAARDADDYRAPGLHDARRVAGTFADSGNASLGLSWVGERGYLGMAYSYRDDDYGLPGHSHEYEDCHPHGSALHCGGHDSDDHAGHDHDHEHEHESVPTVALLSKRIELRGELESPFAGAERIRLRASHTDYRHHELEGDEIATTFTNEGYEGRLEVHHTELAGWRGVVGLQWSDTEFAALGEEAFMPQVASESLGLFVVEHLELSDAWHLEAGARHEWQRHKPLNDERNRPKFSDSATSLSAAAIWQFVPDYRLTLSVARSQRLPHAQELYARGVHLATNTYECGMVAHPLTCGGVENNAGIDVETSNNVELSLRKSAGDFTFSVGGFYNKVDDYIYARTLDQYEDFRLIKYTQRDAKFTGLEAEARYRFNDTISATVFGDYVRAELTDDGNLPRIPAARYGVRLDTTRDAIGAQLEYYRVTAQDDLASYEVRTPGHDMLNLTLSFTPASYSGLSMFIKGSNLLDEEVWNHASFLARSVPLPGRNVSAGMRLSF